MEQIASQELRDKVELLYLFYGPALDLQMEDTAAKSKEYIDSSLKRSVILYVVYMVLLFLGLMTFWSGIFRRLKDAVWKANTIILILPQKFLQEEEFRPQLKRFIEF